MDSRRRLTLAALLACCLVLAGCNAIGGGEPTPSVTPAPVPDTTPVGISDDGLNVDRLADAHRGALLATNYTMEIAERVVIDGRVRRVTTRRREVAQGARAYVIDRRERTVEFSPSNYAGATGYWYNGTVEFIRYSNGTTPAYARFERRTSGPLLDPTEHRTVAGLFAAFAVEGTVPTRRASGEYAVRSDALTAPEQIPGTVYIVAPRNGTLRAVVDERGIVRRYRVSYTGTLAGTERTARVIRETRLTAIGTTRVRPPAWVATARRTVR